MMFRARVFEEPLVADWRGTECRGNAARTAALLGDAKRSGPDDFSSLNELHTPTNAAAMPTELALPLAQLFGYEPSESSSTS
jgi:hypothetical protein